MVRQDLASEIEEEVGIVVDDNEIQIPTDKAATEYLTEVVEYLFQEGYLTTSDLPIESGPKRYLLNVEPMHKDGEEMRREEELLDGVFLEKNYSPQMVQTQVKNLLDEIQMT